MLRVRGFSGGPTSRNSRENSRPAWSLYQLKVLTRDIREKEAGSIQGSNLRKIDADIFADASPLHCIPEVSLHCEMLTVAVTH
jgi:hypothetical protein